MPHRALQQPVLRRSGRKAKKDVKVSTAQSWDLRVYRQQRPQSGLRKKSISLRGGRRAAAVHGGHAAASTAAARMTSASQLVAGFLIEVLVFSGREDGCVES